jgi:phosphosulfolactate synthase
MSERAWDPIIEHLIANRAGKPRAAGVTSIIDLGIGLGQLRDLLGLAGAYIDQWKFAFGTSALITTSALRDKLALLAEHEILTLPGGTLLEIALVERHCRDYMRHARALGFGGVEISDGTIPMPAPRRRNIIHCALDAGLIPITEVGKKDPRRQPSALQIAEQALLDLENGARWTVVEARGSGRGVGIFDEHGHPLDDAVTEIAGLLGDKIQHLIWEAPLTGQQAYLIRRFGGNVGLGNIPPGEVLAVESLRCGLRFETLQGITDGLVRSGSWDPAQLEPAPGPSDCPHGLP